MRELLPTPRRRPCPPLLRAALAGEPLRAHAGAKRSVDTVMDSFWRPRAARVTAIVDLASRRAPASTGGERTRDL